MSPNPSTIAMMEEEEAGTFGQEGGGANLSEPFYYLAGPMSNLPRFNFPAFHETGKWLRSFGLNICNPAEFDHEIARAIMASKDGSHRKLSQSLKRKGLNVLTWAECLDRDIRYVAHPNCEGVIVMDGWERSEGAQFETYIAYKYRKPIYTFSVANDGGPALYKIDRRAALEAAGVQD